MTTSSTNGPHPSSRLMCLTCHRAHATSSPDAGRWDYSSEFMNQDGIVSGSWPIPSPFADINQRSLCKKCHYDDADEHGRGQACLECHGGNTGDRTSPLNIPWNK